MLSKFWLLLIIFFMNLSIINNAFAVRESRPLPVDNRIRVMVYNPDDVFKYTGFYGYQASIEFAADEVIDNISVGDSVAWQLVPSGRRLFLKPVEPDATTNMTLLTNKHMYHFELHAKEASSIEDPDMIFTIRFIYPDEGSGSGVQNFVTSLMPDLSKPEKFNFNYTISGVESISPIRIFDDGEFTYFKFPKKNADIPAFFLVNSEGNEELVNYRITGEYVVVERVTSQFTLRSGTDIVCVFNETRPINLIKRKNLNSSHEIEANKNAQSNIAGKKKISK
jgi:type IV secretion system protein VirB9